MAINAPFSLVGDSYLAAGYGYSSDAIQGFVAVGLSTRALEQCQNPWRMSFIGNKAVGGYTMSQIYGTVPAALATMANGDGLLIADGGINDVSASVPASIINGYWDQVIDAGLAAGKRVLVLCMIPLQTPFGDARDAIRTDVNAYLATRSGPNVYVFNSDSLGFVSGDYTNQLHLNSLGSEKYGAGLKVFLAANRILPPGSVAVAGDDFVSNVDLAGGTTVPTGWSVSTTNAGGATVVTSKVAGKWRVAVSGSKTGNGRYIQLLQAKSTPPFPAGDSYVEAVAAYEVVSNAGGLETVDVMAEAYSAGFANTLAFGQGTTPYDSVDPMRAPGSYIARTPVVKIATVAAAAFSVAEMRIYMVDGAVSPDFVLDFSFVTLRQAT